MVVEEIPVVIEPALGLFQWILRYIEVAIGGIFGIYLILVILRWYESHRLAHILKDIQHEIKGIAIHIGVTQKERMCAHTKIESMKESLLKKMFHPKKIRRKKKQI